MVESLWMWIGFLAFVIAMLAVDLGIFHRKAHAVSVREAATWTGVWVALALTFCLLIFLFWQRMAPTSTYSNGEAATVFLTAYIIEQALSVDNMFVFVMLFTWFAVPALYQHRVLFWGVIGAQLMRGLLIVAGAALISRFSWILYIFGAFLVITGFKMAFTDGGEVQPDRNPVLRWVRRFIPVSEDFQGQSFFVRHKGILMATPLLLVLVVVETTDLVFALDSIPAIFAVTQDPFLVFTSNILAILGLRSLYFLLAGVMDKFHFLKLGLAVVLTFVGLKMVSHDFVHISTVWSLAVVAGVITVSIGASLAFPKRQASAELGDAAADSLTAQH